MKVIYTGTGTYKLLGNKQTFTGGVSTEVTDIFGKQLLKITDNKKYVFREDKDIRSTPKPQDKKILDEMAERHEKRQQKKHDKTVEKYAKAKEVRAEKAKKAEKASFISSKDIKKAQTPSKNTLKKDQDQFGYLKGTEGYKLYTRAEKMKLGKTRKAFIRSQGNIQEKTPKKSLPKQTKKPLKDTSISELLDD